MTRAEKRQGWEWVGPYELEKPRGSKRFFRESICFEKGREVIRVSVGDVVITESNDDDEETSKFKLKYWVGQIGALYECDGEKYFCMRFFEFPKVWKQNKKIPKDVEFLKNEMIETDVCEENPIEIIQGKVSWQDTATHVSDSENTEDESDNEDDLPDNIFSNKLIIRCESNGRRVSTLSDSLWPACPTKRFERLAKYCEQFRTYYCLGKAVVRPHEIPDSISDAFERAAYHLQLSAVPEQIPCRNEEKEKVENFIKESLHSQCTGSGNVLYVSGMPGTGKTATILGVINRIIAEHYSRSDDSPPFWFIHINALQLHTPTDIFNQMCEQMELKRNRKRSYGGRKEKKNSLQNQQYAGSCGPVDLLDQYFAIADRKGEDKGTKWLLLLDEIDFLVNRSQAVCYKVFDWPTMPNANISIIAISNTMDLPERMIPRVASRLGMTRLNFLPYNREQICEVLRQRLTDADALTLFDPQAVQLCAMRIAASCGDIRKALQVLRRAVEVRKIKTKVTPMDVQDAQQSLFANLFVQCIASLPLLHRRILLCALLEIYNNENGNSDACSIPLRKLWLRFDAFVNQQHAPENHFRAKTFKDFERFVNNLQQLGIASTRPMIATALSNKLTETEDIENNEKIVNQQDKKGKLPNQKISIDPAWEGDENGSNFIFCLNDMIDLNDMKHALTEETNDFLAQRYLQEKKF